MSPYVLSSPHPCHQNVLCTLSASFNAGKHLYLIKGRGGECQIKASLEVRVHSFNHASFERTEESEPLDLPILARTVARAMRLEATIKELLEADGVRAHSFLRPARPCTTSSGLNN